MRKTYNRNARTKALEKADSATVSDINDFIVSLKKLEDGFIYDLNVNPFILTLTCEIALKKLETLQFFHADHTFGCTIPNYPILLIGGSDIQNRFHIISISICKNEKQHLFFMY